MPRTRYHLSNLTQFVNYVPKVRLFSLFSRARLRLALINIKRGERLQNACGERSLKSIIGARLKYIKLHKTPTWFFSTAGTLLFLILGGILISSNSQWIYILILIFRTLRDCTDAHNSKVLSCSCKHLFYALLQSYEQFFSALLYQRISVLKIKYQVLFCYQYLFLVERIRRVYSVELLIKSLKDIQVLRFLTSCRSNVSNMRKLRLNITILKNCSLYFTTKSLGWTIN